MTKKCEICEKLFEKNRSESAKSWAERRFCSIGCAAKNPDKIKNQRASLLASFSSGRISPWNKGKTGLQVAWNKGQGEYAKKLGFGKWMKGKDLRELSGNWKGEKVSYGALHDWVRRRLGTPDTCVKCGFKSARPRMIHWANLSHEYKRDLNDWIRLCAKCHKQYDKGKKQTKF